MIAIIPARGGSKGLPRKNIKLLNGKPLIAYTIEAALKSKRISRLIISTDDEEIATISESFGGEVPFMRPDSLATDMSTSLDVLRYTFDRLEREENIKVNEFVLLQPTSPLRKSTHIDEAVNLFYQKKADAVISACKEMHSIFWHKFITEEGQFENIFQDNFLKNRQELRETYRPNGAIYIFNQSILQTGEYYTEKTYAYVMDSKSSVDIDTIDDFAYVEYLMKKKGC